MTQALTLCVKGVSGVKQHKLFKFLVSQNWGYITNLDIKHDIAYVNLVNWKDKFPQEESLSLKFEDKNIIVDRLNWSPRKKWESQQFSILTSFIDVLALKTTW